MLLNDPNHVAGRILTKLRVYYGRDNIEEVVINRPGEIWIKQRRADWVAVPAPELTYDHLRRVCSTLANINNARFDENDLPVVSCELPGAPFRFQAVMGPNVRYSLDDREGVAMAIRALTADTSIDFGSYGLSKGAHLPGAKKGGVDEFGMTDDHVQHIMDVINRHESIVVSGATSTGKTTFTNKIIEMLGIDERIITVEDARELTVPNPNRVHLMVPRNRGTNNVTYATIIDSLMRLTPDWIICGELSVDNAQPVYATMGKGHPIITTVHAGSPKEAVSAFANNMSLGSGKNAPLSGIELVKSIRSQIGCIIQLERRDGKRQVVDIVFPSQEEKEV
jgi:type IV secretion system protein VirB11